MKTFLTRKKVMGCIKTKQMQKKEALWKNKQTKTHIYLPPFWMKADCWMYNTKYTNIKNMACCAQGMCWSKHKASTSPTFSQYVNKVSCYMYDWVTWWSESARTPQIVKHPTNFSKHITNLILPMWSFNHCVIWYLWKWYLREMKVWLECKYNKIWTLYIKKHTYLILFE